VLTQRVSGVRETFENFGDFGQHLGEGTGSEIAYAAR